MPSRERAVPCSRPHAAARIAGRSPEAGGSFRGVPLFEAIVRPDDPRDELVADDVAIVEVDHRDALDVPEDLAREHEAALFTGEVDLRDVAGDDGLRAESETREEHLHLRRGRVLRLVEDDERLVQRAATHVPERSDLDLAALGGACETLRRHELVERVVQRAKVRIDLLLQVARQESEPLPRLHGRPREDEATNFAIAQRRDAHGNRQKRLALAGWG